MTRTRIGRALGGIAAVALLLAGCGESGADGGDTVQLDGEWRLVEGEHDGASLEPSEDAEVTLTIDRERWRGTAACNTYDASVTVDGDRVRPDDVAVTEMACHPPELMELERAYLDAFLTVERTTLDGDGLQLHGPGTRLDYARVQAEPDADLVGTRWQLESLVDGPEPDSGVSSPAADAELRLDAGADGRAGTLTVDTGCAQLGGSYELDDTTLEPVLDQPVADCDDPALRDQHDRVVALLDGEVTVDVAGPRLRLTADDGRALELDAADG